MYNIKYKALQISWEGTLAIQVMVINVRAIATQSTLSAVPLDLRMCLNIQESRVEE